MADMNIISKPRDFASTWSAILSAAKPKWLILDANWNPETISSWITGARSNLSQVAFEPVSVAKAGRVFPSLDIFPSSAGVDTISPVLPTPLLDLTTPNILELAAMHTAAKANGYFELPEWWSAVDAFGIPSSGARDKFQVLVGQKLADEGVPQMMVQLLPFCPTIVTKLGAEGIVIAKVLLPGSSHLMSRESAPYILARNEDGNEYIGGIYMRHFPAAEVLSSEQIVSVNGVGDTFLGVLVAGLARGLDLDAKLLHVAQKGSVLTLGSVESVSPAVQNLAIELDALVSN
jgi:pseudouridine-5'-phosphate glycosidase/pseudouridine kinase